MNAPDRDRPLAGHAAEFAGRFFDRQRRETLDRIRARRARRRVTQVAAPLAAALLLGAVLVGTGALRGPQPSASDADWLFAWSLPEEQVDDPLAAFGPWSTADAVESEVDATPLLPPLPAGFPVVTDPLGETQE